MTTRRKTIEIVGAAAASVAFPQITGALGSASDQRQALDHVVVLMFENRSFDNLLGCLYAPGEVQAFEGVTGKELANPIPEWAEHGAERKLVPYGVSATMNTPQPDPGEEYPHINTDLFAILDPKNRFMPLERMVAPYNAPGDPHQPPTMDGFVMDYISSFTAEMKRQPSYDEYAQIMTGYTPEQMPVLSALARGFAVFDHWFCEVPSQTFTNRSFFHAGTASGYVVNMSPPDSFPLHNRAETLFERLEAKGLTWRVYCDAPSPASFTGIIHASRLRKRFATNFSTVADFLDDAKKGRLPTYAFIEPNLWHGHNDMHPPISALLHGLPYDPPSSLLGGEALLASVYDAVRSSSAPRGSNYLNTFLLVAFDESGGTYDHVPPPPAVPPTGKVTAGQMGFGFDRSGARVPAIAISAWIPERTVVNDEYRHTSLIQTLRKRWSLGKPLTARDASARDIRPVLSLGQPRAPDQWPEVRPRPVPKFDQALLPPDLPLSTLGKALTHSMLALEKSMGATVPTLAPDATLTGAEAMAMIRNGSFSLFPGLRARS
jgi:phospholipase C